MSKEFWAGNHYTEDDRGRTEAALERLETPEGRAKVIEQLVVLLEQDLEMKTSEGVNILFSIWGKSPHRHGARPSNASQADSSEKGNHLKL